MNPHKGNVELKAGDKTYVLRYSVDALCSLEARVGKNFVVIFAEMINPAKISITLMREVLFAGLSETHPDMTLKEAGDLIVPAGGIMPVMKIVNTAFGTAFPQEASGTPRPPNRAARRRTGTGRAS